MVNTGHLIIPPAKPTGGIATPKLGLEGKRIGFFDLPKPLVNTRFRGSSFHVVCPLLDSSVGVAEMLLCS